MADAASQPDALALADSVKFAIQHRDEEIERLTAHNKLLKAIFTPANIINAEFKSDPMSVQCFDLRIIKQLNNAIAAVEAQEPKKLPTLQEVKGILSDDPARRPKVEAQDADS